LTNLQRRVIVAAVGVPLILAVSFFGDVLFFLFIILVSSLALREFYILSEAKGARPSLPVGIVIGAGITLAFFHGGLQRWVSGLVGDSFWFPTQPQLFLIVSICGVLLIMLVELFRTKGSAMANIGVAVVGFMYVSLFLATLVGVRELFLPLDFPMMRYFQSESSFFDPERIREVYRWGGYTVITVFVCIWLCDTAAYFAGLGFGRHKLFPRVSPNKTWEGSIGGFVAAVGAAIVMKILLLDYLTFVQAGIVGGIVGIFGQLGDLVESLLKRDAGVKDSSAIIPGHGGVFDRFDSLILVAPIVYLYLDFVVFS